MDDIPTGLYNLFESLRKAGIPLGAGDYLLAVQTLRAGKGLEDIEELKFTCCLLWTKSLDDIPVFESAFQRLMAPRLKPPKPVLEQEIKDDTPNPEESESLGNKHSSFESRELGQGPESWKEEPAEPEELLEGQVPLLQDPAEKDPAIRPRGVYQLVPRPPISRREMSGIWRHLRAMKRTGPLVELDVEATVHLAGRLGHFIGPVLRPRRQNQVRLLILVDRSALMTPFRPYVDVAVEGIRRSGLAGRTTIYYFDRIPSGYLSPDVDFSTHRPVQDVLQDHARGSAVLIVGDAGAAEEVYRARRFEETLHFLKTLRQHTYLYAWLNPFPANRWLGSTAEAIASRITMHPMNREGLIDAVNVLRGQPTPPGVRLDA